MKKVCILITLIATILIAGCTNDSFPKSSSIVPSSTIDHSTPHTQETIGPVKGKEIPQTSTQQSANPDEKIFKNNKWNELSELRERELPLKKETITKSEYIKLIKKPISYASLVLDGYEGALFCSTRNILLSYPVIQTNNENVEEQIITYLKLPDVFSNNLIVEQSGDNIYVLDKINGIFALIRNHTDTNKYFVDCAFKLEDKYALESIEILSVYSLEDTNFENIVLTDRNLNCVKYKFLYEPSYRIVFTDIKSHNEWKSQIETEGWKSVNLSSYNICQVNDSKVRFLSYDNFKVFQEYDLHNKELSESIVSNYGNYILTKQNNKAILLSIEDTKLIKYIKLEDVNNIKGSKIYFYQHKGQLNNDNTYQQEIENNYIVLFTPEDEQPIKAIRISDEDWIALQ